MRGLRLQTLLQQMPIKKRARISLATRSDITMPDQTTGTVRIMLPQCFYHSCQHFILSIIERLLITAFQLDADGEIIAVLAPQILRAAGMPGALIKGHELNDLAITPDQQMCRHLKLMNLGEVRMRIRRKLSQKKLLDIRAAKLAWWQADVVNDRERHLAMGPRIEIRRGAMPGSIQPMLCCYAHACSKTDSDVFYTIAKLQPYELLPPNATLDFCS